jgi:quinol monooxygenase YgiN
LLEARPGKEAELEAFLKSAQPLVEQEPEAASWYAVKIESAKFGIFDTFANEEGRTTHLAGEIAKALLSRTEELLVSHPQIEKVEILATKPVSA